MEKEPFSSRIFSKGIVKNYFDTLPRPQRDYSCRWLGVSVLSLLLSSGAFAHNTAVKDFGEGGFGTGWQSDDTRTSAGTDIINATTHNPDPSATLDPAAVDAQIDWTNFYASRGNLGGVSLTGTPLGGGKSTISVVNTASGLAAASVLNSVSFSAAYRWQNTDTVVPGPALKFGIQSTNYAASQTGFTAQRSGEAAWDLVLAFDPTNNGQNSSTPGQIYTSSVTASSKFALFSQAGNVDYWVSTYGAITGAGATIGINAGSKTIAEWAAVDIDGAGAGTTTWGEVLFGAGAKISNTQLGMGSGNAEASGIVDWLSVSYLNGGAIMDFVDGDSTSWIRPSGENVGFSPNWDNGFPSSTKNAIFSMAGVMTPKLQSANMNVRSLGVNRGTVNLDLNGYTLTANSAENGTFFAESGASLSVFGSGTLRGAVLESAGTVNVSSITKLDGGALPNPVRDGTNPAATTRYGVVVHAGGVMNLQSGADVTVSQSTKNVGIRVGEGPGTGVLNVADGATLSVGNEDVFTSLTSNGFIVVGDFGSTGIVNQSGGLVSLTDGSFNLGNQGGTGTYNLSSGTLSLAGGLHSLGRNTGNNAAGSGTLNISGGLMEIKSSTNNGPAALLLGDRDASNNPLNNGTGLLTQTAGVLRVAGGSSLFLGGHGASTYNLNGGALEIGGSSLNGLYQNPATGSYQFNLGGGTIKVIGSALTTSVNATLVNGSTSTLDTNGLNAAWSGVLSGTGTLVKAGDGKLTLSGNNNLAGQAYVTDGEIAQTAGTSAIKYLAVGSGAGMDGIYSLSDGSLATAQAIQVGDWGGTGTLNQTGGEIFVGTVDSPGSLNVGNQGGTGTYNLSGGSFSIVNGFANLGRSTQATAGDGTLSLSGSGVFTVGNGGDLIIGDRDGTGAEGNGVVNQTGGTLRVQGTGELWIGAYGAGTYNLNAGALEIGGSALNYNYLSPAGGYAFNLGGGTIKVIGSALSTSVNATLASSSTSTLDTNGLGATFSGVLSGDGTFRKTGAGLATVSGNNSFTGGTIISEGTFKATHAKAAGSGGVSVLDDAVLEVGEGLVLDLGVGNDVTLAANGLATYTKQLGATEAVANFGEIVSGGSRGTTAALLNGTHVGARTVEASFSETSFATNDGIRVSDVIGLEGLDGDVFVLQLSYDEVAAAAMFGSEDAVRMGWLDGGEWVFAATGTAYTGAYGVAYSGLVVGSYGLDTSNNVVWAVLDHNSDFAVVPEPCTGGLLVLGLLALLKRSRSPRRVLRPPGK